MLATPVCAELSEQEREQKEAELEKLRSHISSLRNDIDSTRTLHNSVSKELQKTEVAIGKRINNLKQLNRKLDKQTKLLEDCNREKAEFEKNSDDLATSIMNAFGECKEENRKLQKENERLKSRLK